LTSKIAAFLIKNKAIIYQFGVCLSGGTAVSLLIINEFKKIKWNNLANHSSRLANTNGMIEHLRSISQATATAKGRVAVVIMDRVEQHGMPLEKLNVLIISFHSNCITAIFSRV
jgi:hypothetical protein